MHIYIYIYIYILKNIYRQWEKTWSGKKNRDNRNKIDCEKSEKRYQKKNNAKNINSGKKYSVEKNTDSEK